MHVIETNRLYLRELTVNDAQSFYQLNKDVEVLKFTGDQPFETENEAREFLSNYNPYQENGFGRWAVIRKQDEVFVGWCGLKKHKGLNEVDVGFRFFRKYWGQGYATEAALASLKLGFETYQLDAIVGNVMDKNHGSIRVLEKIGMTYVKSIDFEGESGRKFMIKKHSFINTKIDKNE